MDRNQAKQLLPIIQAYAEGKTIQTKNGNGWIDIDGDEDGSNLDSLIGYQDCFRIKPEPKYRPFANAVECWREMLKHQPLGWVKGKKDGYYILITTVDNGDYMSLSGNSGWSFYSLMKDYIFADDVPFGVKVEE